nr:hypothetical protein [Escherichia coli]
MNERLKTHSKTQKKSADLVSNKLRIGVFQQYQMKCKSVSKKSPRYTEEPESEDARYYQCAQRLYCGEGESLLAELCAYWESYPSTQADNLLLQWSKRHCPDYFALLVMVIEARSMVDAQGQPLKYVPGESARTGCYGRKFYIAENYRR